MQVFGPLLQHAQGRVQLRSLGQTIEGNPCPGGQARLSQMAYRAASVGQVLDAFAPSPDDGMKTKKNWVAFADQFRKAALATAEAAKARKEGEAKAALEKLNASCTKCHDVFR